MTTINPFSNPSESFDVNQLKREFQNSSNLSMSIEKFVKDFFYQQVIEDISDNRKSTDLQIYKINRVNDTSNKVEIIQAYTKSQAVYLYLLYQTKDKHSHPFTDCLDWCLDLGSNFEVTPYDIYSMTIQEIFGKELLYNDDTSDYLSEVGQLIILRP